ncbi:MULTISPECIES: alpha/beta fold hydrolase [Paraburkholderia]|nr:MULTISPECIES: alpha/beta fold hydrolase [Paraburkholderia]MCX4174537.1 alpha/beta fold hydrolase [Paraburkholderia madseniana]MDQ6462538.1 alpha/beta fold hydrolase [Paraburkholderia madseniana]
MAYVQRDTMVSGVRSRMFEGGEGETVLFLHGAAGLTGWLPYFESLSHRFKVLAPEHPGYGEVVRPDSIVSIADLAEYYKSFTAGLGRFHLIGSSLGGWLASMLALLAPAEVQSLTLIAPAGMRERPDGSGPGTLPSRGERLRRLYFDQGFVERILAQDPPDIQQIETRNWATSSLLGGPGFYNPMMQSELAKLACPTLILWGKEDQVVSVEQARLWGNAITGADVRIFSRCGHLPHLEMATMAAGLTQDFINKRNIPA